jgi:uncharacterized protein (TIGR02996 family)
MPSPGGARPEVLAFLADVKEHPQEDGLRLIFADWLEENGDALDQARAELIRCQVELARLPPEAPERAAHGRRARALQQTHGKAWLGPLEGWLSHWSCQRGLLSVYLSADQLRSHALVGLAATETWAWVDEVYVTTAGDNDVARLGQTALLSAVVSLGFRGGNLGPAGAQALGKLPLVARLHRLDLDHNHIGDRGLAALLASPHLGQLRTLELAGADLTAEAGGHLARAPSLARLERLSLWGNQLGNDGAEALARSEHLRHLRQVDLRGNAISDAGAAAIASAAGAGAPLFASLRELNLADNDIRPDGARALANSLPDGLTSLVLWGNPVGIAGAQALRERFGPRVHVGKGE